MKFISWTFNDMKSTELVIRDRILLSKGQWQGLQFSVFGLGLTKLEREFLETRFLEVRNVINIYLGRFSITYNRKGAEDHLHYVRILKTQTVGSAIKEKFNGLGRKISARYYDFLNRRQFGHIYEFQIDKYYEGTYSFKSDMLSAFQLASNYEADLMLRGNYLLSPLGLSYEENRALIAKYLGKRFLTKTGFNLRDYKHDYDPEIRDYKKVV